MDDIRYANGKPGYYDPQAFSVQGSAPNRAEEEKPWQGEETRNQGRNQEATLGQLHPKGSLDNMADQHGDGHQTQQKMENMCGLHEPKRACPKDSYPLLTSTD